MTIDEKIIELAKKKKTIFEEYKKVEEQIQNLKDIKEDITLKIVKREEVIAEVFSNIRSKVRFFYSEDSEKETFTVEGIVIYNNNRFVRDYTITLEQSKSYRILSLRDLVIRRLAESIVDSNK